MTQKIMYFLRCPLANPSKQLSEIIRSVNGELEEKTVSKGLPGKIVSETKTCHCKVELQFSKDEADWAPLQFDGSQQSKNKYKCAARIYNIEDISKEQQKQMAGLLKPYKTETTQF